MNRVDHQRHGTFVLDQYGLFLMTDKKTTKQTMTRVTIAEVKISTLVLIPIVKP